MLFLAVFCVFLAENFREHQAEHQQEQQYLYSMAEDLRSDTAQLHRVIAYRETWQNKIDTVLKWLASGECDSQLNEIYDEFRWVSGGMRFLNNDRTFQQLKNAGGLRLIRKRAVSDSIIYYDQELRRLLYLSETETQMKHDNRKIAYKIFRWDAEGKTDSSSNQNRYNHLSLLSEDPVLLNEFCGDVKHIQQLDDGLLFYERRIEKNATDLIGLIKNEYHLKWPIVKSISTHTQKSVPVSR